MTLMVRRVNVGMRLTLDQFDLATLTRAAQTFDLFSEFLFRIIGSGVLTVPVGLQLGQQLLGGQQVSTLHRLQEVLLLPHAPSSSLKSNQLYSKSRCLLRASC